jgi:nitroreductase
VKLFSTICAFILCIGVMQNLSGENLSSLLQQRHSGYLYDSSKSISKEQLQKIAEAARTAPSCYNDQPWHFVFSERNLTPDAYTKILNSLVEFNQGWAKNAPVLVVITADTKFQKNGENNRWGSYDSGAAAFAMMLSAADMGLMAHQMGGFDEKKMQSDLQIPARYIPMAVMAIGYEASGETPKVKERKQLSDNFFLGAWGKGLDK